MVIALDAGVGGLLSRSRVGVGDLDGFDESVDERLDLVRVLLEVLGCHDQVGRDELAVGPEVGLVDEDLAAAFLHEPGRPRLGHPGAGDVARWKAVSVSAFSCGTDGDVAAAGLVGRRPSSASQARRATSWVLPS